MEQQPKNDERPELNQPSGIFEPKSGQFKAPVSGTQKANRLLAAIVVILLAVIIVYFVRGIYFSPVRKFYRGLSRRDSSAMTAAFPSWLVNADTAEGEVTVEDMCAAIISNTNYAYGKESRAKVSLSSREPADAEKYEKLSAGIKSRYGVDAKVSKGWICTLNVQYTGQDGTSFQNTEYVTLYKINGSWCILDVPNLKK